MKRTILVATLVLGSSVCSQSFGFDLLDRMLGLKGCGAHSTCCDTVVCDTGAYGCAAEPACGCEAPCGGSCVAEPACGCEAPCGGACGCAEPACGIEAPCAPACEPTCGAAAACCGKGHRGLLHKLFGNHCGGGGCDAGCGCVAEPACGLEAPCGSGYGCAAPACGCEVAGPVGCDSGCCGSKRPHLLARLFGGHGCDSGCDAGCCDTMPSCGCSSTGMAAPVAAPPVQIQDAAPMPPAPVVDPSAYLNSKRRVIQASARYVR